MSKFKVGSRVRITDNVLYYGVKGATGTISKDKPGTVSSDDGAYIKLDKPVYDNCFDCMRKTIWVSNGKIELIDSPVIVITTDGKTTTATMRQGKKVLKTGYARCNDKDTFDFEEGARIAFERLQGREPFPPEEKPELTARIVECKAWPKKVLCIRSTVSWFKPGLVYKVCDFLGLHAVRDREPHMPNVPWPIDRNGDLFRVHGDNVGTLATFAPITED